MRARRLPVRQRGIRLLLQQAILGGAELGYHEFRQLWLGNVDRLPMRHPRGLDRGALQREWPIMDRSIDRSINDKLCCKTFSSSSPSFSPDRGRDGKLVAVDLFHLYGHTWGILRYESDSRCAVRVSEIDFSGEGERILTLDYTSFFFFFSEIRLFDGYIKLQFFVNYLFIRYRFFFTFKLYLVCILSAYIYNWI